MIVLRYLVNKSHGCNRSRFSRYCGNTNRRYHLLRRRMAIIGKTPVKLLIKNEEAPVFFAAGDEVYFLFNNRR